MALFDLIFKHGTIVNHCGIFAADIAVKDGRIADIGSFAAVDANEMLDCTGLHILPGVIDTQVHFREPGLTGKEDMKSGSLSAVMGGVTSVFEMPNTSPLTIDKNSFEDKIARASATMHCDFAFYVGGTSENTGQLAALEKLPGCAGVKVFMGSSTGSLLVSDDQGIAAILDVISRRAAFHSEDEERLNQRKNLRIDNDPASHPVWRDAEVALKSTRRLVELARRAAKRIHILHVSTRDEMEFLANHKDIVSVEVTPHHLTLDDSAYKELGTLVQMNPPIRSKQHQNGLWRALDNGIADILGSDHAPHTVAEKSRPYPLSPSGMGGVQTLVPIMLDHVNKGRLNLMRFVDMTSAGPNRLFNIAGKGRLAVGYDADLTIVDMKRSQTITNDQVASKAGWTPYDGKKVTGWPIGTIVRGHKVMWEGELVEQACGRPVRFSEALG
ncbi:Dihydroorotase [hydrothermal vent metagenome]|uniref:Dihydroorotase n=1 Tax=hydrothermal vent metagenome TaxID=652676 RepID=A0A3B0U9L5_9ZZZZ